MPETTHIATKQQNTNVIPLFNYPLIEPGLSRMGNIILAKLMGLPGADDYEIELTPRQVYLLEKLAELTRKYSMPVQ